ncbi:MAG: glycosyltransferase, partial [Candidatus Lokiarchaeota archaeon]|nr:glycosyltransferase [Candidatus Lokiarchaeota archaeon]
MEKYYKIWQQRYKDIYFLGYVSVDQIPAYYSMGDIFINYSYAAEGFGLTPIEAIACGTPVICSALPAFKEVLQDHAIYVPPRNPSLLAKEIIKLIKNEEKRLQMVQ